MAEAPEDILIKFFYCHLNTVLINNKKINNKTYFLQVY
jgi:hypothetical protein